jgi:hypothetical protein
MTDLIVVPQVAHWQRLKRLVLDSVSSPITRRVYTLGLLTNSSLGNGQADARAGAEGGRVARACVPPHEARQRVNRGQPLVAGGNGTLPRLSQISQEEAHQIRRYIDHPQPVHVLVRFAGSYPPFIVPFKRIAPPGTQADTFSITATS